jgi:pyrroloquinoline quinone biosynthesis protein B
MAGFLRSNGPWSQLVELEQIEIHEVASRRVFEPWEGLEIRAIPVPHRDEFSNTMAFKIAGPRETVLFVPDVDSWDANPGLLEELLREVTIAYVDATFFDGRELPDRDISEIPHPPMVDTMARLREWAQLHPGALRFIHMNHSNPALRNPTIQDDVERHGFHIAKRGERVPL